MTQAEFEARLRALEQQLQADIALLQAAHAVRARSLEGLRQASQDGEGAPLRTSPAETHVRATAAPSPKRKHTRPRGAVREDLQAILARLPETFDRRDIDRLLGYRPMRATLFRALILLERAGLIETVQFSVGGQRVQYRKRKP